MGDGDNCQITVSVIIPCFNSGAYIKSAINSVFNQTYKSFEVLVIDDYSTDNSTAIVDAMAASNPRLRLIRSQNNSGTPARPRNLGVLHARGEWVAFLDADDLWHPQKLQLQMALLFKTGQLMCSSEMQDFKDDSQVNFHLIAHSLTPYTTITLKSQMIKYMTPTSSIVLWRDVALSYPFPEEPHYFGREDFFCMLKVHESIEPTVKLLLPLVYYRRHKVQFSHNKLKLTIRQLAILRGYRFKNGKTIGLMAYFYLLGHLLLSVYFRILKNKL
jgi:teichuronic acid biosynthesis glycosyltransferase TuaG